MISKLEPLILFCRSALIGWAMTAALNAAHLEAGTSAISATKAPISGSCRFNRIHVSPDGELVVLSELEARIGAAQNLHEPREFVVFQLSESFRALDQNLTQTPYIFSAAREVKHPSLIPLGWEGQTLVFRLGYGEIVRAELRTTTREWSFTRHSLPEEWHRFAIKSIGQVDYDALTDPLRVAHASEFLRDENLRRRTVYLHPNGVAYSVLNVADQHIVSVGSTPGSMRRLGPSGHFRNFGLVLEDNDVRHDYLGQGKQSRDTERKNRYSQPLLDHNRGVVVGRFTPTQVHGASLGETLTELLDPGALLIRDATFAQNRVYILANNDEVARLLVFDSDQLDNPVQIEVCDIAANTAAFLDRFGVTVVEGFAGVDEPGPRPRFGIDLSTESDTTGVLYEAHRKPGKKLILYYSGGPAGTNHLGHIPMPLNRLREEGFDVLAVEYSGSVGAGLTLSKALAKKPQFGFADDANAVAEWVERSGYDSVGVYASSFGAAPAMMLKQRFPQLIDRSVFIGPLLALPSPETTEVADGVLFASEPGSQLQFEAGIFGSVARRNAFAAWLPSLVTAFDASENDLFVFGELDTKTPLDTAPPNITDGATILVVANKGHRFLGSKPETKLSIFAHLSGL